MVSAPYPIAVPPDGLKKAEKVGGGDNHSHPSCELCNPKSTSSLASIRVPEEEEVTEGVMKVVHWSFAPHLCHAKWQAKQSC